MALTDGQVRSFKPEGKRFRKSDGGGLYLEVMPSGGKFFRLACRLAGKQRTYFIGEYPDMRLADARLKSAEYKRSAKEGIDPTGVKKGVKEKYGRSGPFWRDIAQDYLMLRQRSGAAQRTLQKLHRQIQVTIFAVGDREISDITAEDVLDVVKSNCHAGQIKNAHEIRSRFPKCSTMRLRED